MTNLRKEINFAVVIILVIAALVAAVALVRYQYNFIGSVIFRVDRLSGVVYEWDRSTSAWKIYHRSY